MGIEYAALAANTDMPAFIPVLIALLPILMIWSIIWKGLALWKSARLGNKVWFVVLLIVNTLGILEILYLYVFSKSDGIKPAEPTAPKM